VSGAKIRDNFYLISLGEETWRPLDNTMFVPRQHNIRRQYKNATGIAEKSIPFMDVQIPATAAPVAASVLLCNGKKLTSE
jgi:hypothetical protein